jgi:hypothetical protein
VERASKAGFASAFSPAVGAGPMVYKRGTNQAARVGFPSWQIQVGLFSLPVGASPTVFQCGMERVMQAWQAKKSVSSLPLGADPMV